MKKLSLILFLLFTFAHNGFSQPWIREPGKGYAQLGYSSLVYSGLYTSDSTGEIPLDREVTDITYALFTEIGIAEKWMITANIPFKMTQTSEELTDRAGPVSLPAGELNALGNITVRGSYKHIKTGAWVFSPAIALTLNSASYDNMTGLRTGYDAWGLAGSYHAGYGSKYFFAKAMAAFNFRTNGYSSQVLSQLEGGLQFWQSRIFLVADLDLQLSLENGNYDDGTSEATGLYQDEQSFFAYTFKAGARPFSNFYLWVSTGRGFGNLVARAPSFNLSVAYEW